ncbi:MAG: peptidase S45 [Alphaproteobacteria bacterium]|nr:MAG: peptidase S45 [Alphaproteobacteria bacterium]
MKKNIGLWGASLLVVAGLLGSCAEQKAPEDTYRAEVVRTSFGIPHITADDFGSLGFGEGFVAAEDHVCNIAHSIVVARGERALYHGVGEKNKHLMSDMVIRALGIPANAAEDFAAQSKENQQWITGYTEGYNKYIREVGVDNITSWCKGADWVREITPEDLFSRFQVLAQTAPRVAGMIVSAKPPADKADAAALEVPVQTFAEMADDLRASQMGSNGWAFGKDRTENGRGMLLGNPHYPWTGTSRFWEKHLIIPGKMNIYGAHLIGAPGVAIGFNENIGWTHTVSNSERVVFYKLDLVPGDPTSYYYDGEPRKMTARKMTISVKGEDGTVTEQEQSVWFSHYGPMVSLPNAPWTEKQALTMRDANAGNQNLLDQWKAMDLAQDMDAFKDAHRKWNALPWVNTMATSKDGRAVFIDGSNVGRLSAEAIALWQERTKSDPLTGEFFNGMGLILLDGSDSQFEWQAHPEARVPGIVPYVEQPKYDRSDYIFNANDSHWLTHVEEPLNGYSPLFGSEQAARSLRTRINAKLVSDTSPDGPAGVDGKFSLKEMQQALFSNRSLTAELLLDEVVAACTKVTSVIVDGEEVDLAGACTALKGYNKHLDLDSTGAVLFREWITQYKYTETFKNDKLFKLAFDPADPVNTPRGLADEGLALKNLAKAVQVMTRAGLALDSSLGEAQFVYRGADRIAVHGGENAEGIANIMAQRIYDTQAHQQRGAKVEGSKMLTDKGYLVTHGASFLLSLSYTDDGPVAEAFLTYGQSGDPTSVHYTDQTKLFSQKQWRPVRFTKQDIAKDMKSSRVLTGPRK